MTTPVLIAMFAALPGGLVVRIRRSHRRGPGSIPGQGTITFKVRLLALLFTCNRQQSTKQIFDFVFYIKKENQIGLVQLR